MLVIAESRNDNNSREAEAGYVFADDEYVVATAQSVKLDRGIARGPHAG